MSASQPIDPAVVAAAAQARSDAVRALIAQNEQVNRRAAEIIAKHKSGVKSGVQAKSGVVQAENGSGTTNATASSSSARSAATQVKKPRGCSKCGRNSTTTVIEPAQKQ